jgi:hypothetical protein
MGLGTWDSTRDMHYGAGSWGLGPWLGKWTMGPGCGTAGPGTCDQGAGNKEPQGQELGTMGQ